MTNPKPTSEMNSHPDEIKWNGIDYVRKDFLASEVDRVIEERMPSEEECVDWAKDETLNVDGGDNKRITFYLMVGCKWFRNRIKGKQ